MTNETAQLGVHVGKKVPTFTSETTSGPFDLADQVGKTVVLYFYPKDSTPGCTTETQEFGDASPAFAKAGAVVFGISRDSIKSHLKFKGALGIPFEERLVSHVSSDDLDAIDQLRSIELAARNSIAHEADHVRPQLDQALDEPAAEEAGAAGHQRGSGAPELTHDQTFQGARPEFQSASRCRLSRRVSMHCQNESCL